MAPGAVMQFPWSRLERCIPIWRCALMQLLQLFDSLAARIQAVVGEVQTVGLADGQQRQLALAGVPSSHGPKGLR